MTSQHHVVVPHPEAMRQLGSELGELARPGDIFLLFGPFGAGKTTLGQGLAAGLGVREPLTSPSFVIETQYRGRLVLNHLDLFRLEEVTGDFLAELEEHLFADAVSVVEWPSLLPQTIQAEAIRFSLELLSEESARLVTYLGGGQDEQRFCRALDAFQPARA